MVGLLFEGRIALGMCFFPFFCFSKRGFNVKSFGSGVQVKLPGPAPDRPNIYSFDTTYDEMYRDLLKKDPQLYPVDFRSFSVVTIQE